MKGNAEALVALVRSLETMPLQALREVWRERLGEPPRLRSVDLVRRHLAWRLQAEAFGGLDAETRKAVTAKRASPVGPTLPCGVRLAREWQGKRHEVEILQEGVRYGGQAFDSLSSVAREITGVRWNGPRFFGLRDQRRKAG